MNQSPTAPSSRPHRRRLLFGGIFSAALVTAAVSLLAPTAHAEADRTLTSNLTGTHNGYFFSFWKDSGNASMVLRENGRYSSSWSNNTNNWVGGKGWKPGSNHTVNYSGNYNPGNQNTYLALYGWTTSPLIEYYILENWGSYNPAQNATRMGSVTTDGSTYGIYRSQRVNAPSIIGNATFYQYWSVRESKRTGGTITVANHFNAWRNAGMNLGQHDYQVMATEGYQSNGSSDITVSSGSGPQPTSGPTSNSPGNGSCSVTVSRAEDWNDRFNTTFTVSGKSNWTVRINTGSGQSVQNSWNASISGSSGTLTATPNGSGNSFGITLWKNGNGNTPTASCS
jgi:endo-1,4-beta-xylanase